MNLKTSFIKKSIAMFIIMFMLISTFSSLALADGYLEYSALKSTGDKIGQTFQIRVVGSKSGRIWGDEIYTADSNLNTAAVHAGYVKEGESAIVTIKILPGQSSYPSVTRNGITSIAYNSWDVSYQIISSSKTNEAVLVNPDIGLIHFRNSIGDVYNFRVVGTDKGSLWGDGIYTDDSTLGKAAVHSGALKLGEEGVVTVKILPSQNSYNSTTKNNIESKAYGKWHGSFEIITDTPTPKPVPTPTPTPTPAPTGNDAEAFASGSRVMWTSAQGLGYRLFRSTNKSELGISVTDFYITSTSYADVNVEANTTYYYTVKPVLAEARPFEGIDEKLGDTIATFTVTTGSEVYKPGSFKHFIMLKLDSPDMSVDGISQEIDPGRGTTPLVIAGRTMVPIRAIVEAMGGTVGWDGNTEKITLNARGNIVEMWLNKKEIKVNGQTKMMDIAPTVKNGRTFVPVRFAAENLNCKVDWINSTKEAVIVYEE